MTRIPALPQTLQSLRCKELFVLELDITSVQRIGGESVIGVVSGGSFTGSRINGRVLPGGSDWQRVMPDGSLRLDCRIVLEAADGELVAMTYQGVRFGPTEIRPDEQYLRIAPFFATHSARHAWLNTLLAIGTGERLAKGPVYNVFEVL